MKVQVSPYRPEHMSELVANAAGQRALAWHDRRRIEAQMGGELVRGFTARDEAGRILLCGGSAERHVQFASLWAVYADGITRKQWGWLLVAARNFVAELKHRRVDAMVDAAEPMARRWAEACGLACDGVLPEAAPDGGDMLIMRRIER